MVCVRELDGITFGNRRESRPVHAIAADQGGVVARAQLLGAGVTGSTIDRALRSGRLHRIHHGVYSTVAPDLIGEDGLLIAALRAAGDGAVLSHGTAAWRWQIVPAPPVTIELTVPWPRPASAGLTQFATRRLRADDVTNMGAFAAPPLPAPSSTWRSATTA